MLFIIVNLLKNSVLEDRGYIYKKYCLKFQSVFLDFMFNMYKMVDSICM